MKLRIAEESINPLLNGMYTEAILRPDTESVISLTNVKVDEAGLVTIRDAKQVGFVPAIGWVKPEAAELLDFTPRMIVDVYFLADWELDAGAYNFSRVTAQVTQESVYWIVTVRPNPETLLIPLAQSRSVGRIGQKPVS